MARSTTAPGAVSRRSVPDGTLRALRTPSFAVWSAAQFVSNIGTWMQFVAQSLLVLELTHSAALTGLTVSVQAAPALLLGLVGGTIVDRAPRKVTVVVGQSILAFVAVATGLLANADALSVPILMAFAVVTGAVATVDGPAVSLLGNEIVREQDIPSAIAIGSVVSNAGRVLGTAAAGTAIAVGGTGTAYLLNGLSFLAVVAAVPFVRPVRPVARVADGDRRVRAGVAHIVRTPALLGLVAVGALTSILGRNYSLSFAALVTGPLHAGPSEYGMVTTTLAAGAVAGALVAGRFTGGAVRSVVITALVGCTLQAAAAASFGIPFLVAVCLPLAVSESIQDTLTGTVLQTMPPAELRGRVLGAWQTMSAAWRLAGPPLMGWLMQVHGVRSGLTLAAGLNLVGVLAVIVLLTRRSVHAPSPAARSRSMNLNRLRPAYVCGDDCCS